MTREEKLKNIKKIAKYNYNYVGEFDNITLKLIEEMAELTQALIKYDKESKDVIQEVADVLITLNEYITILDPEELDETIDFKLNRTIERLKI